MAASGKRAGVHHKSFIPNSAKIVSFTYFLKRSPSYKNVPATIEWLFQKE